jgi:hypothetical protein
MGAILGRWIDYYCQARHDGYGRDRADEEDRRP